MGIIFIKQLWSITDKDAYRIYSAIRRGFHLSRTTIKNLISSM